MPPSRSWFPDSGVGRSGGLALWTATVAANGAFVWGVPVRLALRTATYTALVRVVVCVQLQIENAFFGVVFRKT